MTITQKPDDKGRIIVSKKISLEEWNRAVTNCKALPGKVPLDEYTESALAMKNDYVENNSPYIDIKSKSKIIELVEDLREKIEKNEEKDTHITYLMKQLETANEELAVYKKVEKKV